MKKHMFSLKILTQVKQEQTGQASVEYMLVLVIFLAFLLTGGVLLNVVQTGVLPQKTLDVLPHVFCKNSPVDLLKDLALY